MYYLKKEKKKPLFVKATPKKRKVDLVKKLDKVFSLYIRLRDTSPNGFFRCISCGQIKPFAKADCGHYFSRRHMATRFSELNCHAECSSCNRFKADHLIGYRENLIKKIGEQRYVLLELESKQTKQWTDYELEYLINRYRTLCLMLKKEKNL